MSAVLIFGLHFSGDIREQLSEYHFLKLGIKLHAKAALTSGNSLRYLRAWRVGRFRVVLDIIGKKYWACRESNSEFPLIDMFFFCFFFRFVD